MVGGGNRRVEGPFTVSNTNVFAALDSLRKKKKSDKDKGSSKGGKAASAGKSKEAEEKAVYWAPAPLTVKSWADVDDEDDDDYYATTAPPQAIWGGSGLDKAKELQKPDTMEGSESEDELLEEVDDDVEEEPDHETEVQELPEPIVQKPVQVSPAPKETEKQLSKKERKKKELAELEAILADFGVNPQEHTGDEPSEARPNGGAEKKENAPAESKTAKKKKKKDKTSKEAKEPQEQPNTSDVPKEQGETAGTKMAEENASVDVKERLKKVASAKKKKTNKEMDAASKAAAVEAAARSARLATAKKKEKNHYNQQPGR